jgi:hypothetical protein
MDTDSGSPGSSFLPLNWDAVAAKVGHGTTPVDCEREFLALPLDGDTANGAPREGSITPDGELRDTDKAFTSKLTKLEIQQEIFRELVAKSDPTVIHAVTEASLKATDKSRPKSSLRLVAGKRKKPVAGRPVASSFRDVIYEEIGKSYVANGRY